MWTWSVPGSGRCSGVLDEPLLWLSARCISTAWRPSSKSERRGEHLYCRWSPNYINGFSPAAGSPNLLEKAPIHGILGLLRRADAGAWLKLVTLGAKVLCLSWYVIHHVFHYEPELPMCSLLGCLDLCVFLFFLHMRHIRLYVCIIMVFPSDTAHPDLKKLSSVLLLSHAVFFRSIIDHNLSYPFELPGVLWAFWPWSSVWSWCSCTTESKTGRPFHSDA